VTSTPGTNAANTRADTTNFSQSILLCTRGFSLRHMKNLWNLSSTTLKFYTNAPDCLGHDPQPLGEEIFKRSDT
jgi:hypothetical protein